MNTRATDGLVAPHGGHLVDRTGPRPEKLDRLEALTLTSRELSDLDMLASGALSPLEGFMGRDDYERVVDEMRLARGLPWALPVCLAVDRAPQDDRVESRNSTSFVPCHGFLQFGAGPDSDAVNTACCRAPSVSPRSAHGAVPYTVCNCPA